MPGQRIRSHGPRTQSACLDRRERLAADVARVGPARARAACERTPGHLVERHRSRGAPWTPAVPLPAAVVPREGEQAHHRGGRTCELYLERRPLPGLGGGREARLDSVREAHDRGRVGAQKHACEGRDGKAGESFKR
jgi:hypothetical protein